MNKKLFRVFSLIMILALALMALPIQSAQAVSPDIVISQVYGGGGNTGAPFMNDFVELFNRGTTTVNITGWSVQYASATGTGNFSANPVTVLSGSLAPGQYYLVQQAGGASGVALPTPDATGTVNMSGTAGKVVVVNQSTGLACNGGSTPCSVAQLGAIVDLAGYGGANFFEGSAAAPTLSNTTSALRAAGGCTDTDQNGSDFSAGTPNPRNTASPLNSCGGPTPAPTPTNTPVPPTAPDIIITEIMYDPNSAEDNWEWIEIYNAGSSSVDLTGFVVDDNNSVAHTSANIAGGTLAAGGQAILYNIDDVSAADFAAAWGTVNLIPVTNWTDMALNNTGDQVSLWASFANYSGDNTAHANAFDTVNYGGAGFPDPVGASIYLTNLSADNNVGSNWGTSTVGGATPLFTGYQSLAAGGNVGTDVGSPGTPAAVPPTPTPLPPTPTPVNVCDLSFTPIYAIQGSGSSAAITGTVTTEGVVVGDFEGSASVSGFYMQDLTGDSDSATSDGIFVFTGSSDLVSLGQVVRVTGFARERFNQTTINGSNSNSSAVPAANIVDCGTGSVATTDVTLPFPTADFPERYEGMHVRLPQALVISEYFNYDRFGEIVLALPLPGETRPFTGTAIVEPGAPANARTLANSLSRITLDDAQSAQNPTVNRHPNGDPFSLTNRFRGGDTVANTVGVLGFDFSLYRIFPTAAADYTVVNPRPTSPDPVGGNLRVAAMNTLNYFITLDYPTGNPLDNKCGPSQTLECRGADFDQPDEFTRQRAKLLAALTGLNADILGLNELENTTNAEPLADIVAGLPGYAYIDTGTIGTDAIKVGLIYKPGKVAPVGSFQILDSSIDPRFIDTKSRPALAQTFEDISTGARFTVVVNHLKSKGSDCNDVGDPDTGDGSGNCNLTRKAAAEAIVDWLATDPTGSGDPDFLIMGDLNSYAQEDPIDAIKAGADDTVGTSDDYTNLIFDYQGTFAYSFVFDGQYGYLDHALANASMASQVTGATEWHINADEPDLLDYDTSFKPNEQDALYEPNGYRSSDHDAVVLGIQAQYSFNGFFPPVANLPGFNSAKAGQAVSIKFSLNGDRGLAIFAAGYPKSEVIACDSTIPTGSVDETVTAGSSSLSYDPVTDTYTYVWKTNKAWANTCRQLVLKLNDGSFHRANFNFNK